MVTTAQRTTSPAEVLGPGGVVARALPGYQPRTPQLRLSTAIAEALAADEHLIAEAPTGTGKSLAYLVAAVLSGKHVIVSTDTKTLQDQLVRHDLPFLASVLPGVDFAVLKGIANYACLRACREDGAPSLVEDPIRRALATWLAETTTGDLAEAPIQPDGELRDAITTTTHECAGGMCPEAAGCFYLQARRRAAEAKIVVVNHALLMLDVAARALNDSAGFLPEREAIVADESHRLEDAATSAFTVELATWTLRRLLRGRGAQKAHLTPALVDAALEAGDQLFDLFRHETRASWVIEVTDGLVAAGAAVRAALGPIVREARDAAAQASDDRDADRIERYAERVADTARAFTAVFEPSIEPRVLYAERQVGSRGGVTVAIKWAPVAVGPALRRHLFARWPVVLTSATLTVNNRFDYARERLGLDRARESRVESPFDFRRNCLIYLPNRTDLDPSQHRDDPDAYFARLTDEMASLVEASRGRAFLLFTSRRAMEAVEARLWDRISYSVLVQGSAPTGQLIADFRREGNAVLLGLRSYWTGVDVQGEALSLVAIDALPFPNPSDPVFAARARLLTEQTGDEWASFARLSVPECSLQLAQGAGRLIRTSSDRGVVAVLDSRITTKRYGTTLARALPPGRFTRSIADVRAFFAQGATVAAA